MPDIFQAFARDNDAVGVHFEVMTQQGSFWYISGSFSDEGEARAHMEKLLAAPATTGVLIDRVTREVIYRREREP